MKMLATHFISKKQFLYEKPLCTFKTKDGDIKVEICNTEKII